MFRTVGVLLAGALTATALVALGVYLAAYVIPGRLDPYFYFVFKAFIGAGIGLMVGSLQKGKAGAVAMLCLLPVLLMQATSRSYPIKGGLGLVMFLLGEGLGLAVAFAVAHRVSKIKRNTATIAMVS